MVENNVFMTLTVFDVCLAKEDQGHNKIKKKNYRKDIYLSSKFRD